MAALLAGARLVLRQGVRFLPAYRVRPAAVPVRCLTSSAKFLTTAVQDLSAIIAEPAELKSRPLTEFEGWSLHNVGVKLKKTGRISKAQFLKVFNSVCQNGKPTNSQTLFLLHTCGYSLPGVPLEERITLASSVWNRLQELDVVLNENHYNLLLKIYIENDHRFSPTEFLAGMEAAGVQPNQTTYEKLIAAYCSEGDIQGASNILGFLKSKDLPITEDVFNSLIRGHARAGDMESAKNMLSVMNGAGLPPRTDTFAELLCAYAEKGDMEGIKQTLEDCKHMLTHKVYPRVINALAKSGYSQLIPDIFEHMDNCKPALRDVINLCLNLLAQSYGDAALLVAKRYVPVDNVYDFRNQAGNFFIRQCVDLNTPVDIIKKYASELEESKLHRSPLEFALLCALQSGNKGMVLELMKTLKEKRLPLRPHYFWPLLASSNNEKDVQGSIEVLKTMYEMDVKVDLETFSIYIADLFKDAESAKSILQEKGFEEGFKNLYVSALKIGILNGNINRVYNLLSSKIPFVSDVNLLNVLRKGVLRSKDVERLAKITKLLCQDHSSLPNSLPGTDSVGYFLYGLIVSMSDSEVQAREEHLKQYFHQLKKMELTLDVKKAEKIIQLLQTRGAPLLIEELKTLVPEEIPNDVGESVTQLEEQLENERANNLPFKITLNKLLSGLIEAEDLEKVLDLTSKYGSHFDFYMYAKVISLCCKKNDPKAALKIKEEMDRRCFSETLTTLKYISLVKVLAMNDHIEDAINILKEMQEKDVTVNYISNKMFSDLLNTLAIRGDVDCVNRLHEHIVMLGLSKLTRSLCCPLIKVHLQRADTSAALNSMIECHEKYKFCIAEELLLKLLEKGETDLLKKAVDYIYNALGERAMLHELLFAFIETGNYEEAQKIVETPGLRALQKKINWFITRYSSNNMVEVLEKCVDITRGLFECDREEMYFQLLSLYEKNNDWAKAITLWGKIKEEGLSVRQKTADLFRELFAQNGQDITAHIPEFQKENYKSEDITQRSSTVVNLCKDSKFNEAYSVFLEANQCNIPLTKTAYARLIKGLLEAGLLEDTLKVEEAAKRHYRDYSLKNISYNLLLTEQVRRDCLKDAVVTLESMLKNGRMPSRVTLNKLVDALAMKGDLDSLEKMEELTITCINLPKMEKLYFTSRLLAHLVNGNYEDATSIIESIYTEKAMTANMDYVLLRLINSNNYEALEKVSIMAERLANQFSEYHLVTKMFIQYVQAEKMDDAKQLLQRCSSILEQGEMLQIQVTRAGLHGRKHHLERLLDLLAESDPTYKKVGYNSLMKYYVGLQNLDSAVEICMKIKVEQIEPDEACLKKLADLLRQAGQPVPFPEPQGSVLSSSEEQSYTSSPSENVH